MDEERFAADRGIAADSRCFDGHFPGNPIAPGAILIAWLSDRLAETGREIARIDRLKFERPLGPDQAFEVIVRKGVQAEFWTAEGLFARARLALRPLDV